MKPISLAASGFEKSAKRTRKRELFAEMDRVVPWSALEALIAPHYGQAKTGRRPLALGTMLRIHFLPQWFGLSDPAMEEALYDVPLYSDFAGLDAGKTCLPDQTTILRFRRLLETPDLARQVLATVNAQLIERGLMLRTGTVVDATLIAAPSSTKNKKGERDPEMHQTKKGTQRHFGMKAHLGVDAESGLVHTEIGTATHVNDVTQAHGLLHGDEIVAVGEAGYQGVANRPERTSHAEWITAVRLGLRRTLDKANAVDALIDQRERLTARIRAKVEHPFRVIKRQFGHMKVRYRGLVKNTAQLMTLFALSNLRMVRHGLMAAAG